MWGIVPQSGLTTTILDFTNDLSPLIVGFIGLTWLSAAMIAVRAIKHYLSQRAESAEEPAALPTKHRDAA